jgi:hypothetical protein
LPTVHARTLKRAAEIVGGEVELARRLKVTTKLLELWMGGVGVPPCDVFLKAADIVGEHDLQEMAKPAPVLSAGKA